jgi:hypothetical protein
LGIRGKIQAQTFTACLSGFYGLLVVGGRCFQMMMTTNHRKENQFEENHQMCNCGIDGMPHTRFEYRYRARGCV